MLIVKGQWGRHYAICLKLFPSKLIRQAFGIDFQKVFESTVFVRMYLYCSVEEMLKGGIITFDQTRVVFSLICHNSNVFLFVVGVISRIAFVLVILSDIMRTVPR